jgi:hypothetical protein
MIYLLPKNVCGVIYTTRNWETQFVQDVIFLVEIKYVLFVKLKNAKNEKQYVLINVMLSIQIQNDIYTAFVKRSTIHPHHVLHQNVELPQYFAILKKWWNYWKFYTTKLVKFVF